MATTFRNKKNHPLGVGTLNTAIDDNDLSIVLDAGQGASFPSATFTISIDEEIILIDSRSTDTLTVNASGRGYDSSTASAHAAGVAITNNQIVKDFTDCETAINSLEALINGTVLAINVGTPDGDVILTLGRAKVGALATDGAYFAHYDFFSGSNYALRQTNAGATILNAPTGQNVIIFNNGANVASFGGSRLLLAPSIGGTLNIRSGGMISNNITAAGNVGSGEDDLMTYTVPAAQLAADKDALHFEMVFKTAANANNKTIKVKFGATTLFDSGAVAANDDRLIVRGRIIRTAAATQIAHITAQCDSGGAFANTVVTSSPTETLSGTVVLKATGEATSDNDIQQIYQSVIWESGA